MFVKYNSVINCVISNLSLKYLHKSPIFHILSFLKLCLLCAKSLLRKLTSFTQAFLVFFGWKTLVKILSSTNSLSLCLSIFYFFLLSAHSLYVLFLCNLANSKTFRVWPLKAKQCLAKLFKTFAKLILLLWLSGQYSWNGFLENCCFIFKKIWPILGKISHTIW